MTRPTLSEALTILACVGMAFGACRAPQPPASTGNALHDLAHAVEVAERSAPVALAACGLVPVDKRDACVEGAHALAEAAAQGRAVLDTAAACQEAQDEVCLASALERAAEIVRVLR